MTSAYPQYRDSGVEGFDQMPHHWETQELGRMGSFFKGKGGTKQDEVDDGLPCIRYGDLYTRYQFAIHDTRAGIAEDRAPHYQQIAHGDVLFAGSGETLDEIGKSAVNLISDAAYCGGDVIVFRPSVEVDPAFLGYAADSRLSAFQKSCMGRGVTVMHIYSEQLKQLRLPMPPVKEQRAIAAFIDRETAKVDELVEQQEQLLERLAEYRTALIANTVTRGLPAEAAMTAGFDPYPEYRDSGVEWLGDVPGHWNTRQLGTALSAMVGGGTPATRNVEYWADDAEEGIPWVAIGDMSGGELVTTTEKRVTSLGLAANRLKLLPVGTVIYAMYASVGVVARLGIPAVTNQAILGLFPGSSLVPDFLYWWLVAIRDPVLALTRSNTQDNLNAGTVGRFPISVPPIEEQRAIAAFLDRETARVDALVGQAELAVERLLEYRSALITHAVTGGIDVRGSVAHAGAGGR